MSAAWRRSAIYPRLSRKGRHHAILATCSAAFRNAWLWFRNATCKNTYKFRCQSGSTAESYDTWQSGCNTCFDNTHGESSHCEDTRCGSGHTPFGNSLEGGQRKSFSSTKTLVRRHLVWQRSKKQMTSDQLALGDPVVDSVGMVLVPIPAGEFQIAVAQD